MTQVIAFEGDGKLMEYVGGYEDWVRVKKHQAGQQVSSKEVGGAVGGARPAPQAAAPKAKSKNKLNFKDAQELERIPAAIQALEREQAEIGAILAAGKMYRDDPKQAKKMQSRATEIEDELLLLMARWEKLEN